MFSFTHLVSQMSHLLHGCLHRAEYDVILVFWLDFSRNLIENTHGIRSIIVLNRIAKKYILRWFFAQFVHRKYCPTIWRNSANSSEKCWFCLMVFMKTVYKPVCKNCICWLMVIVVISSINQYMYLILWFSTLSCEISFIRPVAECSPIFCLSNGIHLQVLDHI